MKDSEALILKATRPFKDTREGDIERFIGDEYMFKGPGTYIPRIEEGILRTVSVMIVLNNHGLLLRAKNDTTDCEGNLKKAGEVVRKQIYC